MRASVRSVLCTALAVLSIAASCSNPPPVAAPDEPTPTAAEAPTPTPGPTELEDVAAAFVAAWAAAEWSVIDTLVFDPGAGAATLHRETWDELEVMATTITAEPIVRDDPRARQPLVVGVELADLGRWEYETTLGLVFVGDRWWVEWAPTTIHPGLVERRTLERRRVWPQRGTIRSHDGDPLRTERAVVEIGVEPRRIVDRELLLLELDALLGVPSDDIAAALDAPGVQPDWFVPVTTIRAEEYPDVALQVESLEGPVVRRGFDRLAPTDAYAAQVLGTVGPITSEQLADWGEPYEAGLVVGRSGLELVYEEELAGTPSGDVRLVAPDGALISVLHTFAGREPLDVVTGLDFETQAAAEAALDGVVEPAALVAIDVPTGQVRAVVSRPVDEFSRALSGAYPPGSTFKTVTAAAFLAAGGEAASPVACPGEAFVGGLRFTNAGGSALGTVSLQTAYAASCNTAFVNVATSLDPEQLADMAARFGFGLDYSVGLNTGGGTLPPPVDDAEFAASAIGQGRVTASPLHMAAVAAAVAGGAWLEPTLIIAPERRQTIEPTRISPEIITQLQQLMRAVVTAGTGGAVAGAGSNVSGKTGSAEFGNDDPPRTHAWFIGFRDDLAFAVLVEGGGAGGGVAGPIAATFLAALDAG